MMRIFVSLGLIAVFFQNMVFWQALLPAAMQQNKVCIQMIQAMDQPSRQIPQTTAIPSQASSTQHMHHAMIDQSHSQHDQDRATMDCHFCQLFHCSMPFTMYQPQLIETLLLIKLIFLTIAAYLFCYLRRLFLTPQGTGPPRHFVFT